MRTQHEHQVEATPGGAALLLTYRDAALILGVSSRTVRRLAVAGEIELVAVGRARRIPRRSIDGFVRGHLVPMPSHTSHAREIVDAIEKRRSRQLTRVRQ